jgi:hypothetical protein
MQGEGLQTKETGVLVLRQKDLVVNNIKYECPANEYVLSKESNNEEQSDFSGDSNTGLSAVAGNGTGGR